MKKTMEWDVRRIEVFFILTIILSVATVLLVTPQTVLGITTSAGDVGELMPVHDPTSVPKEVLEDTEKVGNELFGRNESARDIFTGQLIGSYLFAENRDVIIIFNPGGWGLTSLYDSPQWKSIASGITSEIEGLGFSPLLLEYRRSNGNLASYVDETMAILDLYPVKAKELAYRADFLTRHFPDLKIILAGESNGTIICSQVMEILKDNNCIFSIQTGTPFWHKSQMLSRALIINDNGLIPDSFSKGDFFTIISKNFEVLFGFSKEKRPETIMKLLVAPGHFYSWQNSTVRNRIKNFLGENFGTVN